MARIGLIAVSGVRIYNERLRRHGITLPGFVERAEVVASMPSLGLLTLAGLTPPLLDVAYLERPEFDAAELPDFDLVAISSFTAKSDVMYRIADHYRARGIPVVLGGLHVTLCPDEAAGHADAIVVGDGEAAWPRLLTDWTRGALQPRYTRATVGPATLGEALPRYDLLDVARYNRLPIQTTRGCPLACEFCAASRVLGPYRRKPLASIVREIREVKRLWPHPFVELADDNTFVDKAWSKALVRAIASEGIHWFTETDVSVADDPELLDLLAASGCRQLLIGFESPSPDALGTIGGAEWKRARFDRYLPAIDAIQSRGISVNGCFITGTDGDTPDSFEAIARFVETSGVADVQVTVLTPFPGTALHRRLAREGRLLRERYWDQCTLFDVTFVPKRMSVADLEAGLEHLMGTLYTPDATARRRRGFLRQAREALRATA